jgi:hypothetical protein
LEQRVSALQSMEHQRCIEEGCRCVTQLTFRRGEDKVALGQDQVRLGLGQRLPGFGHCLERGAKQDVIDEGPNPPSSEA